MSGAAGKESGEAGARVGPKVDCRDALAQLVAKNAMLKAVAAQAAKNQGKEKQKENKDKGKDYHVPFVKMNGDNWAACEEPNASPGGMGPWVVTLPLLGKEAELEVTSLIIGLRKSLRERVSDAGCRVQAYLRVAKDGSMEDTETLECFFLDSSNNFRCEYPDLNVKPLVLSDGICVNFCVVDEEKPQADPLVPPNMLPDPDPRTPESIPLSSNPVSRIPQPRVQTLPTRGSYNPC
jgi:hypothetical protein